MTEPDSKAVLARFELLSGLGEEEAARYEPLCEEALAELLRREKKNCGEEAAAPICMAAAALALYRKALADDVCRESSFSAGDVKITRSGTGASPAKNLLRQAGAAAAPYLEDSSFLFERTRRVRNE